MKTMGSGILGTPHDDGLMVYTHEEQSDDRLAALERQNEELTQRVARLEDAVRNMQSEKKR